MKKLLIIIFALISFNNFSQNVDTILDGFSKAIQIPNLSGQFSIKLIDKNGGTRNIQALAYQKLVNNNQMNRLFMFNYPPSVRDTGFLIHSFYNGDENKMWIYLPVVKKVKRISLGTSGGGYFMGSDFSYADFISKSSSDFKQELVGEAIIDGRECYQIKEYGETDELKKKLGYSHVINYYGKDDYFLYARDYYEFSGDLLKTYRVKKVIYIDKFIYPTNIIMTNVQTDHKSEIEVTQINTDEVSDSIFTTRYLTK